MATERATDAANDNATVTASASQPPPSVSIDWYAEGDARIVQVGNVQIEVRLVGRSGRRSRIAIKAPAGAVFE